MFACRTWCFIAKQLSWTPGYCSFPPAHTIWLWSIIPEGTQITTCLFKDLCGAQVKRCTCFCKGSRSSSASTQNSSERIIVHILYRHIPAMLRAFPKVYDGAPPSLTRCSLRLQLPGQGKNPQRPRIVIRPSWPNRQQGLLLFTAPVPFTDWLQPPIWWLLYPFPAVQCWGNEFNLGGSHQPVQGLSSWMESHPCSRAFHQCPSAKWRNFPPLLWRAAALCRREGGTATETALEMKPCSARSMLTEAPGPNWLVGGMLAYAAEILTSITWELKLIMGPVHLCKCMCLIWHNWSSISVQPLYALFKSTNGILVA